MTLYYAPYLNRMAGACLTLANWQELNIQYAACDLMQIVAKPGTAFWQQGIALKTYLAWFGTLILDARTLQLNARNEFVIQSPYDGARVVLSISEFWELVGELNADYVLVPSVLESHLQTRSCNVQKWDYTAQDGTVLDCDAHSVLISDKPGQDALQGKVYCESDVLTLTEAQYERDFELISSTCACPTCKQKFSRAYLHHLLQGAPLLCQRFLMMHNVCALSQC